MAALGIMHESIAKIIGCSYSTLRKHFKRELQLGLDNANANVGAQLYSKALAGEPWAVCFWLKTRAGYRETNRTELTGADGQPLKPVPAYAVTFADAADEGGEDIGEVEVTPRTVQ